MKYEDGKLEGEITALRDILFSQSLGEIHDKSAYCKGFYVGLNELSGFYWNNC